jgi:hypothetical protein
MSMWSLLTQGDALLRLVDLRYRGGVASKLEVQDATTLVAGADQSIADAVGDHLGIVGMDRRDGMWE